MSESFPSIEVPPPVAEAKPKRHKSGIGITIARNSLWLLVDNLVGLFASIYCSTMVARGLGPDKMGDYNFILAFANVLRVVVEIAIPATVRKFAAELMGREDYSALKTLVRLASRLQAKLAAAGVAVGLGIVYFKIAPERQMFAALAVLSVAPSLLLSIPAGALWATENLRLNVSGSLCGTIANLIGVTVSVVLGWGLLGLIASFLGSRIIDCIIRWSLYKWKYATLPGQAGKDLDQALRKRMIRFAANQLVLVAFQMLLWDRMEVFFLNHYASAREIAFFSLPFTLVQQLFFLPNTLAVSAGATLMVQQGRAPQEVGRIAAAMTWFMMLVAGPIYFGLAALSDPLLRLLYGERYLPAIPVLTTLALFGLCRALSGPAEQLLIATERLGFYIRWAAVVAVFSVAANVSLIPHHGAIGAAWAKGGSQLLAATGFVTFMLVRFHVALPLGRMLRLLVTCAAMFVGVTLTGQHMGSVLAIVTGVPLGIAIFVLLGRWLRCLDQTDRDRLGQLTRLLPGRLQGPYLAVVQFLVPV